MDGSKSFGGKISPLKMLLKTTIYTNYFSTFSNPTIPYTLSHNTYILGKFNVELE